MRERDNPLMLHTLNVQFIKGSYNLAAIISLDSVEQDFVEIQRFEDVDLQFSSLLVRQLFPSFSQNYSVATGEVIPRDLAVDFLFRRPRLITITESTVITVIKAIN